MTTVLCKQSVFWLNTCGDMARAQNNKGQRKCQIPKEFVQKYVNFQEVVPKIPIVKIEKFVTFFRKNKENHTPHTPHPPTPTMTMTMTMTTNC